MPIPYEIVDPPRRRPHNPISDYVHGAVATVVQGAATYAAREGLRYLADQFGGGEVDPDSLSGSPVMGRTQRRQNKRKRGYEGGTSNKKRRKNKTTSKKKRSRKPSMRKSSKKNRKRTTVKKVKFSLSRGSLYGCQHHWEFGGEVFNTGDDLARKIVERGFSNLLPKELVQSVFKAIVREFARSAGSEIANWNDPIQFLTFDGTWRFTVEYKRSFDVGTTAAHYVLPAPGEGVPIQTWSHVAIMIAESFITNFVVPPDNIELTDFTYNKGGVVPYRLNLQNCSVSIKMGTTITLQNRTTGASAADTESDDVTANPVKVRLYYVRGNGFVSKLKQQPFTANVCGVEGTCAKVIDRQFEMLPPENMKHLLSVRDIVLQPGGVYETKLYNRYKVKIGKLFMMMADWIVEAKSSNAYNPHTRVGCGKAVGVVADKVMDTRTGNQSVRIGYQRSVDMSVVMLRKRAALPREDFFSLVST